MKDISKDFLLTDIRFTVIFIDMRALMDNSIHIQIEIVKIRYLSYAEKTNLLISYEKIQSHLIIIDHSTDIRISFRYPSKEFRHTHVI